MRHGLRALAGAAGLAVALLFGGLAAPPASAQTEVAVGWSLIPSGLGPGARFRLLIVTSTTRNAQSAAIADYDTHVQNAVVNNGHAAIQNYSTGFKVLGSTGAVNARDHTKTRATDTSAPIYYLDGAKVADDYAGLYDGSWDSDVPHDESGSEIGEVSVYYLDESDPEVWTGTNSDGTTGSTGTQDRYLGVDVPNMGDFTVFGVPRYPGGEVHQHVRSQDVALSLYGLSEVFVVPGGTNAGVTVSKTALTVTEQDTTGDSYTVVLDSEPTANVTVTVAGHAGTDVTPNPTTLTFTASNWDTAQTVTVTAGDDADTTDDSVTLTHSAASTDTAYSIAIAGVVVTVRDNDTAQVTGVSVASGNAQLVVNWAAVDNATGYQVQWKSGSQGYNTGSRQSTVTSGTTTSHTITGLTNGTEYTVRVSATRTGANDGPPSAEETGTPAAPGVTVSTTTLTVTEQDSTGGSYTVVLDTEPTADVTVTVAGHAGTDVTRAPGTLTFTMSNWDTAQTVTVTAGDDADTTDDSVTLTHSAASTDSDYSGIAIDEVAVTVSDNDTAQVTGVSVTSGDARLAVNWTAVDNATGYKVQWKSGSQGYNTGSRQSTVTSGTTTSHTITGLVNGTEYTVRVSATRTDANDGPPSAEAKGTPAVPIAPGVTVSTTALTVTEQDTTGDGYTVVLDSEPTANVTVTVAGHAGTDVTPDPATLTFTASNWETAQTVTVTAGNDTDTTDDSVALTHSAASADSGYSGVAIDEVAVTVSDNDTAQVTGVTVDAGNAQLAVNWTAVDNATGYKVQWKSGNQNYNTGSRQSTVTSGTTTSHTITGLVNGTEYTVRVSATRTDANDGPPSAEAKGTPAAPGVTVSTTALTVTEQDTTGGSYTVVLDTEPTANVVVTVAGHAGTDVTPNPTTLTFTTSNWDTAQTVTVTAGDDAGTTDDSVTLTHSAASADSDYSGITIAGVVVTVRDNDTAQVTGVSVDAGNAQLAVNWTAVDNATGYKVQWKSGNQNYNTGSRQSTVTSGTTTSHTITGLVNGTEYTVRVSATRTDANDGPPSAEAKGTPAAPGVTVSKTALTVTEQDTTGGSYTVVLDTEPTANVVVTVAGHAGTDVTPNPATLTFTTSNWDTAQTVTVTAGNDADTTDDAVTLTHSAASTDNDYSGIAIDEVAVTVSDNDTAQVTGVSVTSGNARLAVNWTAVDNATGYQVQWKSGSQDYNTGSQQSTVTSGSTTSHTITGLANGTEYTVRVSATRTDANDGPPSAEAKGTPAVPIAPGVTVSTTALTVTEQDTTGDGYTVVLDSEPTANVTVTVAGHAGTDVTPDPATLTFTASNWETAQTVTVTAGNDTDTTDDSVALTHSAASADSGYSGVAIDEVAVTVSDNDTAQVTGVTVDAGNAQLAVNWTAVDNATGYKVQWKSGNQNYNTGSRQSTVTSGTTTSHTITGLVNGTEYTVRVSATRTDANDGPPSAEAKGTPAAPGVTVSTTALTVTEQDTTGGSYTVVLDTEPTANVVVTVAGHAGTDVTPNPTTLTFTTSNWDTAQTVTVTAGDDAGTTDDSVTLTHSAASADSDYSGIAIAGVVVTVRDNDTAQVTGVSVDAGNAQLAVNWTAVDNATGYKVQWKSGNQNYNTGSRQSTVTSGTTTSHTITGLVNGTEYTVRVSATRTDANDGPPSAEAKGTPAVPIAPGVTVSTTALTVTEQDTTGDGYTVVLDTEPTANVTVTVAGHAGTDVTPNPATLTFTSTTWSTAQTVTVTAGDDADTTDDSVALTHSAASADTGYSGIAIDEVAVTVSDNDTAQVTGVSVASGNARLVTNWTAVDNATGYKVQWKSGSQNYNTGSRQSTVTSGTTTSHTITGLANGTEYTVRVSATRTGANDGPPSAEETGTPAVPIAPGVTVSTTALTVTEQDTTGDGYTVVLDTEPTANVTVTVAGHGVTDVTPNPTTLTFTASNWDTAQTVTVTAGDDADTTDDSVTLTHSAASTDTAYSGITIDEVVVTVRDNDTAPSTDATLSGLALADGEGTVITLSPAFDADIGIYTASVANGIDTVVLTATQNDRNAMVAIANDDDTNKPGEAQLDLNVGSNTLTVTVTAEDDSTKTYTVTVTRAAANTAATGSRGELRLVNDSDPTVDDEGRLEVFFRGEWGTVCDDRFTSETFTLYGPDNTIQSDDVIVDNIAPQFACQLMGYTTGEVVSRGGMSIAPASQPIWLDDVRCAAGSTHWTGSPPTGLQHCYHAGVGLENCTHEEDVHLRCFGSSTARAAFSGEFQNVPESHDGTEFTFQAAFSEAVTASAEDLRDHAFDVTGGTVTEVSPVDGHRDLWSVTVSPVSSGDVTITLEGERACDTPGAVCAEDGAQLTNTVSVEIPGTPVTDDGITARFEDVPPQHDGETPFTLRLALSAPVRNSYTAMREDVLEATGGTVTRARRIDGRSDLWEITITPLGEGNVQIGLAAGRACGTHGALCTRDGRGLATGLMTLVPGPSTIGPRSPGPAPLTARFANLPVEHDGATAFTLEIVFSEAPSGMKNRTLRNALSVTGGAVTRVRRVNSDRAHRIVTIRPDGWEAVDIALPASPDCEAAGAICTEAGGKLETALLTRVRGPAALRVADAEVHEGPGAVLAFAVTLDRATSAAVSVDYATSDGTAQAGSDYTAATGSVTFAPGETAKTVSVAVLDDSHDEGSETLTLTLSNPSGAYLADGVATGTIENTDAMSQAWIARFGRTVADQVLDAVDARLRAARTAGMSVSLAGQRLGPAAPVSGAETVAVSGAAAESDPKPATLFGGTAADAEETARLKALSDWLKQETGENYRPAGWSRSLTGRELLMGSSFSLAAETDSGGFAGLWGRMAQTRFAGREDVLSLDGDVTTGLLGADYASGRWTTGLVVSHSIGEGGYRGEGSGDIEASVTALTPWAGYAVTERLSVWGAAGYGAGELKLTPGDGPALKTDLGMTLAAAGARGTLIDGHGPKLDAVGDARWVRTTTARVSSAASDGGTLASASAEVTRLRLGLAGWWPLALGEGAFGKGATVTPRLALGVRHDGGDAETGFGADIGGGVALAAPAHGLTVSLEGRGVLTHEAAGLRDRGVAGTLAWNPPPPGRGPRLTLTQTIGAGAAGGTEALLSRTTLEGLAANDNDNVGGRRRLEARFGYGFGMFEGRFTMTPEIGLGLSQAGRDYSLGWRLTRAGSGPGSLELSLQARRRESANDDTPPEHGIAFTVTARW